MGWYHDAEGGDIAARRQAPPGSNLPYPNLASVPPAPKPLPAGQVQAVQRQLALAANAPALPAANDPAASLALGGLTLPAMAPPAPAVPGAESPAPPAAAPAPAPPPPPPPAKRPDGPPILLAFPPHSALLPADQQAALRALALSRGGAEFRVGGFGEAGAEPDAAALALAIARTRRIADALTAAGVPAKAIRLSAAAKGSGGFAQLVFP